MFTGVDQCEMVKRQNQGQEAEDPPINSYYDDQSGYRMKISAFNDRNSGASPGGDKKNELVDIKHDSLLPNITSQIRILIVESEPDMRLVFKTYLELVGAESIITDDGDKAIGIFQEDKDQGKNYNAVLIDTHLKGKLGLDVAKKIYSRSPNQRIVLLTTYMREELPQAALDSAAINDKDILVMPFKLARLRTLLNQ